MDEEKIGALLRALKQGSLSAAAEELGYTPSGISRMMASLEAEFGFPLLIRSRDGLRATRECERLLPHFQTIAGDAELVTVLPLRSSVISASEPTVIVDVKPVVTLLRSLIVPLLVNAADRLDAS